MKFQKFRLLHLVVLLKYLLGRKTLLGLNWLCQCSRFENSTSLTGVYNTDCELFHKRTGENN